ncbi:MAG TPA: ArsA-related P-loop ATPase, partial [Myxococcales bacterium]|nr:ArsA-related P-loop ATPase [Myxococcales bacterium]
MADALLDRRLVVVTGKGGTGKSTLSAALALASARRGKRTLVCEVTAKERVSEFFGKPPSGTRIRELLPNLYSVHVRPREAMHEYALMTLKFETLYKIAFENAAARYFLAAAPSLAEIVMLGKVAYHASKETERGKLRWDLVILDAPATGHGLTFLSVPEVFLRLVQEGPLARDMHNMQSLLADPQRCGICVVTLPEEMPANEAIDL